MLLSLFLAAAAATLSPPPGDSDTAWITAARLANLTVGAADMPDSVTLVAEGAQLRIRARDAAGHVKTLLVPWPTTPAAREDAVALGASLLRSLDAPAPDPLTEALAQRRGSPALPAAVAAPPDPPAPGTPLGSAPQPSPQGSHSPKPTKAPEPSTVVAISPPRPTLPAAARDPVKPLPPAPAAPPPSPSSAAPTLLDSSTKPALAPAGAAPTLSPSPDPPAPAPVTPDAQAPPTVPPEAGTPPLPAPKPPPTPARPPWQPHPWARVSPMLGWRSSTWFSGSFAVDAGVRVGGGWRLGARGVWDAPRTLLDIGGTAMVDGASISAGAWWSPEAPVVPLVGVAMGAASLRFLDGVSTQASIWTPRATLEVGLGWRFATPLTLTAAAFGTFDFGFTTVQLGDYDPVLFSPWEVGASAGLRAEIP